jgi:hypothetical protein
MFQAFFAPSISPCRRYFRRVVETDIVEAGEATINASHLSTLANELLSPSTRPDARLFLRVRLHSKRYRPQYTLREKSIQLLFAFYLTDDFGTITLSFPLAFKSSIHCSVFEYGLGSRRLALICANLARAPQARRIRPCCKSLIYAISISPQ